MTATAQTKKRLEAIISYFAATRGVGHTKTVIEGIAKNLGSAVIVASEGAGREYEKQCVGVSAVALDGFHRLQGQRRPIVFDNFSLITLFTGAYRAIDNLEEKVRTLDEDAKTLREANAVLQQKLKNAEAALGALQKNLDAARAEPTAEQADKKPEAEEKNLGEAKKKSEDKK